MTLARCPFYGFRWPERSADVIAVGGNECGLDVDNNGPCRMEAAGLAVDFCGCRTAGVARPFLSIGAARIRFFPPDVAGGVGFEDWTNEVMKGNAALTGIELY